MEIMIWVSVCSSVCERNHCVCVCVSERERERGGGGQRGEGGRELVT